VVTLSWLQIPFWQRSSSAAVHPKHAATKIYPRIRTSLFNDNPSFF
jgi:hypothetical protein